MNNTENFIKRLAQQKTDLLEEYHSHVCSRDYCNPEHIEHVFLCKFRQIHVCLPDTCDLIQEGVCPLSGACYGPSAYSNYDSGNQSTWYGHMDLSICTKIPRYLPVAGKEVVQTAFATKPVVKPPVNYTETEKKIGGHIETLLYSSERGKINAERTQTRKKRCTRAKDAYINSCRESNTLVNVIDLQMIQSEYEMVEQVLETLPVDRDRIMYYIRIVLCMYKLIQRCSPEKPCIDSVTLGTLYFMRQGYVLDDITVVPHDRFLEQHLPEMNDLRRFGFDKKRYTRGEKLITFTYEDIVKRGEDLKSAILKG